MRAERVTVVVVNHNGAGKLDACLESVFAAGPGEVLLVDSGSTDGSAERAAASWPLRLLSLGANRGPAAARNFGLSEARNDLVLLVDNDVVLVGAALARLVAALASDEGLALVQARSLLGSLEGPVHYDGARFHFLGLLVLRNWYAPQDEAVGEGVVETDCAISLCCLGRRDALLDVGGYDEEMQILFEDSALSYALRMRGSRVGVVEDALCVHSAGTEGLSTRGASRSYPARRSFLHSRNRWIFLLTHYRWRSLVLLAPAFALYGVLHVAFAVSSGHARAFVAGKRDLWRLRGHLRRRRRLIQRGRVVSDAGLVSGERPTFNPGLASGALRRSAEALLCAVLRAWFGLVRWAL